MTRGRIYTEDECQVVKATLGDSVKLIVYAGFDKLGKKWFSG